MEVLKSETFVLSPDSVPDVDDWIRASDPDQQAQLLRDAGMKVLADNIEPYRRASAASQKYMQLTEEDYLLYAGFLSQIVKLKKLVVLPPEEVLPVMIVAQKAGVFDDMFVMVHPSTNESLLVGCVKVGDTTRYYKIAHWGRHLTSIEELKQEQKRARSFKGRVRNILKQKSNRDLAGIGGIAAILSAVCWLILLPVSWWLFAVALTVVMVLLGIRAFMIANELEKLVISLLVVFQVFAMFMVGILRLATWATADRTEEVLVCGAHQAVHGGQWVIETSAGDRNLDSGFFGDKYYLSEDKAAAEALVGKRAKITMHGYAFGLDQGPYVTKAEILGDGVCRK